MTHYDPDKHHRSSNRMKGYDYTQAGVYFVTIVTYERELHAVRQHICENPVHWVEDLENPSCVLRSKKP
jgi:hypothetical protein